MSSARFKIRNQTTNGAWSPFTDGGFDSAPGDVLELKLEDTPALDTWQAVFSSPDRSTGRAAVVFDPVSGEAAAPTSIVEMTVPAEYGSWQIQAQTNGGVDVLGDETVNTKSRIVAVRTAVLGLRHPLAAELTVGEPYDPARVAGTIQEAMDAIDVASGGNVPTTRSITAGAGLTGGGDLSANRTIDIVTADVSITVNANNIEASGNFAAKPVVTSGSVTAGSAGLIAPKWDRATAGAVTIGGGNATSIACSGLGLTSCVSVTSAGALALSAAAGNLTCAASAAVTITAQGALTLEGTSAVTAVYLHDAGGAGMVIEAGGQLVCRSNSSTILCLTGGTTRLTVGSTCTFTTRVEAPRHTANPATPTSSSNAVTFDLKDQNQSHLLTEDTAVSFAGQAVGQRGHFEFIQQGTPRIVTMPPDGSTVEYDDALKALVPLNTLVAVTAFKRTLLLYEVIANNGALKVYIYTRSTSVIP